MPLFKSTDRTGLFLKRTVDFAVSAALLVVLSPLFLIVALAVILDSGRPVFFTQIRTGRRFRLFRIHKFRTMRDVPAADGSQITIGGDPRITRVGRLLRATKLDELPQLWNVLAGEMSLVGPRPEVPEYVELFRGRYERVLSVRPGITDLASLQFHNEEAVLQASSDPLATYREEILPAKLRLAEHYTSHRSLWLDLTIMARTASRFVRSAEFRLEE
jgi:lipopolysaccharide/colanic/teichoic acid biosynthesis glycosyltransferase